SSFPTTGASPGCQARLPSPTPGCLGLGGRAADPGRALDARARLQLLVDQEELLDLQLVEFGQVARARGAGLGALVTTVRRSAFGRLGSLNTCKGVIVTITDRMAAWRRERQVLARVSRAAWRLEQAGRERSRALASARAEGVLIRTPAAAAGLTPGPGAPDHGRRGPGRAGRRAGRVTGRGLARSRRPGGGDHAEPDGRGLVC